MKIGLVVVSSSVFLVWNLGFLLDSDTSYCKAYSFSLLSFKDPVKKKKPWLLSCDSSL